ncbi:MAG TPA: glycoside hydrolase family 76 protein [Candidatus Sulfotelmatobacter sp.]|nr:glycoside hydrolase family 76 protein [Candidatus Sulfotelmatobacter sp.]
MKLLKFLPSFVCIAVFSLLLPLQQVRADDPVPTDVRAQFFKLCDLAAAKVSDENSKGPFFIDSYGVRALCVAYDMTGNTNYLNACREWSLRMVRYQDQMIPRGAYYMHYNRKPGEKTNDWYAADSSSIGMAVLATAVRCHPPEQKLFIKSAKKFANLVIKNYVKPSGGVSDGLWHRSSDAWWCSSGLFGSFMFNLYANTGDKHYLKTALGITDWLNHWDLTKDQPFPLSQQGPAMIMYVMENYSAGWPYITQDDNRKQAAMAKVAWCFDWINEQQQKPLADRQWQPTVGWGMKFGGLPFHQYVFSRYLADEKYAAGDAELQRLAPIAFADDPSQLTQLPFFMLMSYAERLDPGDIYRSK